MEKMFYVTNCQGAILNSFPFTKSGYEAAKEQANSLVDNLYNEVSDGSTIFYRKRKGQEPENIEEPNFIEDYASKL